MKQYVDFANLLINPDSSPPIHNCLLNIQSEKKNINYTIALGKIDATNKKNDPNYRFRTGSITKTFTSTIILQLMEEGLLQLDETFLNCLKNTKTKNIFREIMYFEGINYSNKITIKNLLQHKSGIRDYFSDDERFFINLINFPNQSWKWREIMKKYFEFGLHEKGVFRPGMGFHYSDTNYLLLAVLIEDLTHMTFHDVLETRIFNPLSLNDTYLEFFQNKKGSKPIIFPFHGNNNLKNVNTSFDWGGGGLISSTIDLNVFIKSLLKGELFNDKRTLQLMMNFEDDLNNSTQQKGKIAYGLGVQKKKIGKHNFIGHNSAYGGMVFYNLETDSSFIININQVLSPHKAEWLLKKTVEAFLID